MQEVGKEKKKHLISPEKRFHPLKLPSYENFSFLFFFTYPDAGRIFSSKYDFFFSSGKEFQFTVNSTRNKPLHKDEFQIVDDM